MRAVNSLSVLALALVAACSGPPDRVFVPTVAPEGRNAIRFASVELRDVSLPAYAQEDDIYVLAADGMIRAQAGLQWADAPARAATLDLARGLATRTGARTASEPWPFDDYPEARVEVRIAEFVAVESLGAFRVSGQYFVADMQRQGRDRARSFTLDTALPAGLTPGSIALAQAQAMADLATLIATEGLR